MQLYMATDLTPAEDIDIGNACDDRVYLASDADAVISQLQQDNARWISARDVWTAEMKARDERIKELEKAMERLGSSEAFHLSRSIHPERDKELLMRMDFARLHSSKGAEPGADTGKTAHRQPLRPQCAIALDSFYETTDLKS